mgnify:CR=1 FL=1
MTAMVCLGAYQFSVDVFDWNKTIIVQLGFCIYGEHWSDTSFPNYFQVLEVLGHMVKLN